MDKRPEIEVQPLEAAKPPPNAKPTEAASAAIAAPETAAATPAKEVQPYFYIYVCDDALPLLAEELIKTEDLLNDSAVRNILGKPKYTWDEPAVRNLLDKIVANPRWRILVARNPEMLKRHFESSLDKPDLLVFDWDYAGLTTPTADYLFDLLKQTYCLVRIYTHVDKIELINDVLNSEKFKPFKSRCSISEKAKIDAEALLADVQKQYGSNFSYQFGSRLRKSALGSLEEILVSLGKLPVDQVMAVLNAPETKEADFKEIIIEKMRNHLREDKSLLAFLEDKKIEPTNAQELIDLIAEKLRNDLNSADIQLIGPKPPGNLPNDAGVAETAKELWSYRLYHHPSDNGVRRGDIVKRKADDSYFVVISADCDLHRLWRKNYGYVNLVPLFQLKKDDAALADRFKLAKMSATSVFKPNSLTDKTGDFSEGTLLLPFVPVANARFNFLAFPKEIFNISLEPPKTADTVDKIRNCSLSYDMFTDYGRICTLSEPFLTPFIHTLVQVLSGLGVPDYPPPVKNIINESSRASLA